MLGNCYGSFRGFIATKRSQILYRLSVYNNYKQVEWESIRRLVFVCKGNICRSAYAEAVAHSCGLNAVSVGLQTTNGCQANHDAIVVAKNRGFDLASHRTKAIDSLSYESGDLFVAMEPYQARILKQLYGKKSACTLAGLWGTPVSPHIQDPHGKSLKYFNHCFCYIEGVVSVIEANLSK